MGVLETLKFNVERIFSGQLILIIIVVVGLLVYFGPRVWEKYPTILQNLPATVSRLIKEGIGQKEGEGEKLTQENLEPEFIFPQERTYTKTAEAGDGITHLARRALKSYLSESSQGFEVTPEHKIYIEDYIAKQMGNRRLKLGEKLEISGDLLKEAVDEAEALTPEQLQNLTQFSQLVFSLNY